MHRHMNGLACALILAVAPAAHGQQPMGGPPRGGPWSPPMPEMFGPPGMHGHGISIAGMLLAHTAELKLTDQQVTRLAAIARRTGERHDAMHATMDSLMRADRMHAPAGQDVSAQPGMRDHGPMMDRMHEQEKSDLRDALTVLTIDQQVDAWMMRGHGDRHWR